MRKETGSKSDPSIFISVEKILGENLAYIRSLAASSASPRAKQVIDSFEKAKVYKNLSGERSYSEIARAFHLPRETVRNWIMDFSSAGIIGMPSKDTRFQKGLFTLAELGIDLDSLRSRLKKEKS